MGVAYYYGMGVAYYYGMGVAYYYGMFQLMPFVNN